PGVGGAASGFLASLEDLAAAVHAGLEVDVVGAAELARILVLDIGRCLERIGGAAHPAPRRRWFSFRDGHCLLLLVSLAISVRSGGRRNLVRAWVFGKPGL